MLSRVAIKDYSNFVKASNGKCFYPIGLFSIGGSAISEPVKKLYIYSIVSGYLRRW